MQHFATKFAALNAKIKMTSRWVPYQMNEINQNHIKKSLLNLYLK